MSSGFHAGGDFLELLQAWKLSQPRVPKHRSCLDRDN